MAAGFLAVYALERFQLGDAQAGVFTAILMASNTLGYAFWGNIGDRWGYKRLAEIGSILWLGALAIALLAPNVAFFYLVFVLFGLSNGSGIMADFNIAMEFGTLTGPWLLVAPLLGGWLVLLAGYPFMMTCSSLIAGAGLVLLWLGVSEPRWLS